MRQYEVNLIVDPVLSNDEIQATAQNYVEHLKNEGCEIVHLDEMGLRQLAYPIKKRNSGVYYCIEFKENGNQVIDKLELALRRDERVIRFLTVALDKYGVKYNDDKRKGLIGKKKKKDESEEAGKEQTARERKPAEKPAEKPTAKPAEKPTEKPTAKPAVAAAADEEE